MGGLGRSKFTEQMPQGRGGHGAAGCCCRVAGLQGGVVEWPDRAINSGMGLSTFFLIICVRVRVGMCDRECVRVFVCVHVCVCVFVRVCVGASLAMRVLACSTFVKCTLAVSRVRPAIIMFGLPRPTETTQLHPAAWLGLQSLSNNRTASNVCIL